MTKDTNRNNVKLMPGFVTAPMMVLLCLLTTGTFQGIRSGQFSISNSMTYSSPRFMSLWIPFPVAFLVCFSFLGARITFVVRSATLSMFFLLFRATDFARRLKTIFFGTVLRKFRRWLGFLAFVASFRYDLFSHIRSFQRVWLEPFVGHRPAYGSFHFNILWKGVK